ncbi:MAG TPA: TolC family protein [Opitutaceae bacterium]|jgi:outer membrane protein|nr:TolC family protein [Opitutaceae bacterium]
MKFAFRAILSGGALAAAPVLAQPAGPSPLTLAEAHAIALRQHPRANAAQLQVEVSNALVQESRSAYLPTANAYLTAVDAGNENTRILAGAMNNPSIYDRAAGGVAISQLLTDFGRTTNLTAGSKLEARAEGQNAAATRQRLLFEVDLSFFSALQARAILHVADQTLQARRYLVAQVSALARNKLKSSLDVSFSQVAFEEAELLRQRAAGDQEAAEAALSADLGYPTEQHFQLADPSSAPDSLPDLAAALAAAHRDRPDLARLSFERDAARRFSRAENDLSGPTVTATGTVGDAPWRDSHLPEHYAAGGVNLSFPIFTGGLYGARQRAARLKADIAGQALREAEDNADRDVRIAWVSLRTAGQRQTTAAQLVRHARDAYELAQARYRAGSSSIVELSQAEVEQTSAEIGLAGARYGLMAAQAALDYQTGALK